MHLDLITNQSLGFLGAGLGGERLSSTAHLVTVEGTDAEGRHCSTLLGVGHLHRADGHQNHKECRVFDKRGRCRRRWFIPRSGINGHHLQQPFQFGYLYTHFFYTMQRSAPYRMTATTGEFCIASAQDSTDCESAQYVSSLARDPLGDSLILALGVNDCEAKIIRVPLEQVGRMLRTLPGEMSCRPTVRPRSTSL